MKAVEVFVIKIDFFLISGLHDQFFIQSKYFFYKHTSKLFNANSKILKETTVQDDLISVSNFYQNRDSDGERAYKVLEENGQLLEDKKVMVEALQIMKTGDYKALESRMSTEAVSGNFFITYTGVHVPYMSMVIKHGNCICGYTHCIMYMCT